MYENTLFIKSKTSIQLSEEEIKNIFSKYGSIKSISIRKYKYRINNEEIEKPSKTAFIVFNDPKSVK